MTRLIEMLVNIKNSQMVYSLEASCVKSQLNIRFLNILLRYGLIRGFSSHSDKRKLVIFLKYTKGYCGINNIRFISTPGHRVYLTFKNLLKMREYKFKLYFLFTTQYGIISMEEALKYKVGGELFCVIT